MRIQGKLLADVVWSDLQALIDDQVPESPTLDYKEQLPGWTDSGKKELLADVSALANSSGGVLLYGVSEKRDAEGHKTDLPEALLGIEDRDLAGLQTRLEQVIRSGLDPPLSSARVQCIASPDKRQVVVGIGVPTSLLAPHAVAFATTMPFWRRVGRSKSPFGTSELRQAFSERDAWEQEALAFRDERIDLQRRLVPDRLPFNIFFSMEPALFLQVLPIGRLRRWIDLRPHSNDLAQLLNFGGSLFYERFTFDGILRMGTTEPVRRYVQWFRFGGVEVFAGTFDQMSKESNPREAVTMGSLTFLAVEYAFTAMNAMDTLLAVPPPYMVFINVLNVHGRVIEVMDDLRPRFPNELAYRKIAESNLLSPPVLFEERPETVDQCAVEMRLVLDAVWQAGGLANCWLISPDGHWKGRELAGWKSAL